MSLNQCSLWCYEMQRESVNFIILKRNSTVVCSTLLRISSHFNTLAEFDLSPVSPKVRYVHRFEPFETTTR